MSRKDLYWLLSLFLGAVVLTVCGKVSTYASGFGGSAGAGAGADAEGGAKARDRSIALGKSPIGIDFDFGRIEWTQSEYEQAIKEFKKFKN